MTSRERIRAALRHEQPDRTPIDLGSTPVTGIQASSYIGLKRALGLPTDGVRVDEPFQMLAELEDEVRQALSIDTLGIGLPTTVFGFRNDSWKPFRLFDGSEVLVSGHFEYEALPNGDLVLFPQGDRTAAPSAKMPEGGFYFDLLARSSAPDLLDAKRWAQETFGPLKDEDLRWLERVSRSAYEDTQYALVGNFTAAAFGGIAGIMAPHVKGPTGIRTVEDFWMAYVTHPEYVKEIFHHQLEIQLRNLGLFHQAVGDRLEAILLSGTDFGGQQGLLISPEMYREFFKPLHLEVNRWVHVHTGWKTLYHTCGAVSELLDDFVEAQIDILNPLQISARGMGPAALKAEYGDRLVFWGGAVDTQQTLPFGTVEEVREEVRRLHSIWAKGGGYVSCPVHNIQANVPVANILAYFDETQNCCSRTGSKGSAPPARLPDSPS
ncbi:MAG: methyltransferase [Spirochaetales bacterium]|nr:methyltransferase [Spirochaetales bacterium]